jgi:NitT/TauT family transport system substrate-binding protein
MEISLHGLPRAAWKRLAFSVFAALILLSLSLTACAPQSQPASSAAKPVSIKIAVLPIIDALPLYVAQKQGYFTAENLSVTFIPAASAAERDQLIAAGQADGMINDLVSVMLYNKQSVQVQTVRFARTADAQNAMYRVLAAKNSGLKTPADLAGVPIGMSQSTVIDYVTSRLLEKEGLQPGQIQSVAVPKLPDRLALLSKGEIKAATLPQPYGTIAMLDGAVLIVDDASYPEYGNSVISFRKTIIDQHPAAVKGFLTAIEKAVADINKQPEAWRSMLGEYKMVPDAVLSTYPMPSFPTASVPSEAQWKDVIDWAKSRGLINTDLEYGKSVTGQYLP